MANDPMIDDKFERQAKWKGAGSAAAGAGAGALIGSVVPGVGTAIGAVAGGLIGGTVGLISSKKRRHQEALGKSQAARGLALERSLVRPTYTRPKEINQSVELARRTAMEGMPQESADLAQAQMDRNLAYSLGQMETRKTGLMGIGAMGDQMNQFANSLAATDAQMRLAGRAGYGQALQNAAQYSDKEFQYNQADPYMMKMNQAMALQGAGLQNQSQAFNEQGRSAMNYAMLIANLGKQAGGQGLFSKKSSGGLSGGGNTNYGMAGGDIDTMA